MLGRTAAGLFWMCRYLERSENTARMLEAGSRIAVTRWSDAGDEWASILTTTGTRADYEARKGEISGPGVLDFLLRDRDQPSSVLASMSAARTNARAVRTALTREVWEAVNEAWMAICAALDAPVPEADLPNVLNLIRQQSALVRGTLHGTMLRNDIYDFARIGTFLERADNTARILDVKYYVLLPSVRLVGSAVDNVQWDMILRSLSAHRSFRWLNEGDGGPEAIGHFLIFDKRMPRSLISSQKQIAEHLQFIVDQYGSESASLKKARARYAAMREGTMEQVMSDGLHEYLGGYLSELAGLSAEIEDEFRFYR